MNDFLHRLQRNLKIIKKKKQDFIEIEQGKINGRELNLSEKRDLTYQVAVELIMWINNTDQLLFENSEKYRAKKSKDEKYNQTLYGIRHAFNLFKHDMNILSVEQKRLTPLFKKDDNEYYIESTVWLNVKDVSVKPEYESANKAYKKYLEEKSLYETFNYIVYALETNTQ